MTTQSDQIAALIESNTALKNYFESKRNDIDESLVKASEDYDALYETAFEDLALGLPIGYEGYNQVFDLENMLIDGSVEKDVTNPTYTKWKRIDGFVFTQPMGVSSRTVMQFTALSSISFGYYEDPRYSITTSRAFIEFVVSDHVATNESINQSLIDNNIEPTRGGAWAGAGLAQRLIVPSSKVTAASSAHAAIYFRFVSTNVDSNDATIPPQDIDVLKSAYFTIHSSEYYN